MPTVPGDNSPDRPPSPAGDAGAPSGPSETVDLDALAEKVWRLLKEEARLERERLGRRPVH